MSGHPEIVWVIVRVLTKCDSLEEGMVSHPSILCCENLMNWLPSSVVLLFSYLTVKKVAAGWALVFGLSTQVTNTWAQSSWLALISTSTVLWIPIHSLYVMHPFWNTVVKVFPTWLAPNLQSALSLAFCWLCSIFYLWHHFDPDTMLQHQVTSMYPTGSGLLE